MYESLRPHFFSRIFRKEGKNGGGDCPHAPLHEEYIVELFATRLSTEDNLYAIPKTCADHVATDLANSDSIKIDQQEKVGSARVSITEIPYQNSEDKFISCIVEQLDICTGDKLIDIQAFAALIRHIQSLCVEHGASHLAGSIHALQELSTILLFGGFDLCSCECPLVPLADGKGEPMICVKLRNSRSAQLESSLGEGTMEPRGPLKCPNPNPAAIPATAATAASPASVGGAKISNKEKKKQYWAQCRENWKKKNSNVNRI